MAKKRKKKRPAPRPTAPVEQGPARQEKKEAARKEREARVRHARRRVLLRRLSRVGILLLIVGLIAGFIWWRGQGNRRIAAAAAAAAERIGCTERRDVGDPAAAQHITAQDPIPTYETKPAASGPHRGDSTLGTDIHVFDEPITPELETLAVHNLEHGYVIFYYSPNEADAPSEEVVKALTDLANDTTKTIIAPYQEMPAGTSLAFVGWAQMQTCDQKVTDANDAVTIAKAFMKPGRSKAPEPTAP